MLTELGRRMDRHSENFSRAGKYKEVPSRSNGAEEYNNWTEKYTRGFNGRLDEAEKTISQLEDRAGELTQLEQEKEKRMKRVKVAWGNYGTTPDGLTFVL